MIHRRDERLERREATAGGGAGAAGLAAKAHRGGDGDSPGDGEPVSPRGGDRGRGPGASRGKTGHFPGGVHRPRAKSGHYEGGVHRLRAGKCGHFGGGVHRLREDRAQGDARTERECLRGVPRGDRPRARSGSQRQSDLAGPRGRPRLRRRLLEREALRVEAAGSAGARGARRDHNGARRGIAGRLRRGADGARSEHGQVPPDATLRDDAGLLAQGGAAAVREVELSDLGAASRGGIPPTRWNGEARRPRQPPRGCAETGRLRPGPQPALPGRARALRRRGAAVPGR